MSYKQYRENKKSDLQAVFSKDPAATSKLAVKLTYAGYRAVRRHRRAHWFYNHNMKFFARVIAMRTRFLTGVEIHPAAKLGKGVFIDHGMGVVIGETAEVGNNVTIYQGVTLGGTGKDTGKRHPTIEDDVMISSGAKILGPFVVGKGSKIGAGSVVLKEIPPHSTVVGIPGRVVRMNNEKVEDMNQTRLPDPILEELGRICRRISFIENEHNIKNCKYSITQNEIIIENEVAEGEKLSDKTASKNDEKTVK